MAAGRAFSADDFAAPPASRVVLSDRAWKAVYGGSPAVVGSTIRFAGGSSLVVGVAPARFAIPGEADLWFAQRNPDSIGHHFDAFVRFRPGVTPQTLGVSLGPMWEELARKYPDQAKNRVFVMRPLLDAMVGGLKPIVLIAFAATGLLLILAMVNVANLLLARGTTRAREAAIRTALGAGRWDALRPLLAESLLLAGMATCWRCRSRRWRSSPSSSSAAPHCLGWRACSSMRGYSCSPRLVMIVAAALVGVGPGAAAARSTYRGVMNEAGRGGIHGRATRRALAAMIVIEVTVAIALVAGGGRLLVSMRNLLAIDPGFTAQGRLAIDVLFRPNPYADLHGSRPGRLKPNGGSAPSARPASLRHRRCRCATSGIRRRSSTSPIDRRRRRRGRTDGCASSARRSSRCFGSGWSPAGRSPPTIASTASPSRSSTARGRASSSPIWIRCGSAVNPWRFARRVDDRFMPHDAAIVGVVDDVPYKDVTIAAEPTVYVSEAQVPTLRRTIVVTAADGRPERLVPQIRDQLAALDPRVPIEFAPLSRARSRARSSGRDWACCS